MVEQFLFCFTFLFGIIALLTKTKIFDNQIAGLFDTFYWGKLHIIFKWLDVLILVLSLMYQINYWLYN